MCHKGRNKHHFEYWIDISAPNKTPFILYKYTVEMICDTIAASIVYNGKKWIPEDCLNYFENRKDLKWINDSTKKILKEVYESLIDNGLDKTIDKKKFKKNI